MTDWLDRKGLSFNILTVGCQTSSRRGSTGGNVQTETEEVEVHCLPPSHALFLHLLNLSAFEMLSREPRKRSYCCQRAWACPAFCWMTGSISPSTCMCTQAWYLFFSQLVRFFHLFVHESICRHACWCRFCLSMCASVHQREWVLWGWVHAPQVHCLNWTFFPKCLKAILFISVPYTTPHGTDHQSCDWPFDLSPRDAVKQKMKPDRFHWTEPNASIVILGAIMCRCHVQPGLPHTVALQLP